MYADKQQRQQALTMKLVRVSMIGSLGWILLGLAIYAIWGAKGDAFLPILNDPNVANGMLILGVVIVAWETRQILGILKEKKDLQSRG
jgi:hypothetical protein